MKRSLATITLIAAVLVYGSAVAQVQFEASIDRNQIAVNETTTLHIFVESDESTQPTPELPALDDFDVYASGRSHSYSMVNGRSRTSVRYDYVLSPRARGNFTIGPATVTIGGKEYKTEPLRLTVTASQQPPAQALPRDVEPEAVEQTDRRIFITMTLDKDTAYVNEQVVYIFRFYRGERLLSSPEYTRPSFPGFWVEELPPQRKYTTTVRGINYEVTEIRTALFPTDAGQKRIAPARLKATVRSRQRGRTSPFGSDLFGFFGGGEDIHLRTAPVSLTVLPFPTDGKPDDWGGLVGRFEIESSADVQEVNVGDPITVAVVVRGNGNVKSIQRPAVDTMPDFRMFPAGSSEDISKAGYRVSGQKTFEEVFVPQRPGSYTLPAFSLTYFDPDRHEYRTVRTDSIPVTVAGGATDFTIPSFRLSPDEMSDLAADVRFLKTDGTDLRRASDPGLFGWAFWVGHVVPLFGLAILYGWRRRVLNEAADPAGRRRRLAYKSAIGEMNVLENRTDAPGGTRDLARVLLQYYADRYNCPAQGQRRSEMMETMLADGVDAAAAGGYLDLLDRCDRSRYTPGESEGIPVELVARSREALARIEGVR
jgi:hypothetical protein